MTGRSLRDASAPLAVSLKPRLLFGLNGMKWTCSTAGLSAQETSLSASNRTIKISASIAITFGSKQPNSDLIDVKPVLPKNCDRQHNICKPIGPMMRASVVCSAEDAISKYANYLLTLPSETVSGRR